MSLRILIFCSLFLFSALVLKGQTAPAMPDDEEDVFLLLTGEADKAIENEDYHTAVERIREALDYDPSNPGSVLLLSNLGILYGYIQQDSLALKAFDEALARAPQMSVVHLNRGKLLLKLGRDAEAAADFAKVIERDSLCTDALFYHGIISLYGGDREAAENDIFRLKDLQPNTVNTNLALALLYCNTGRDLDAVPLFRALIDHDPQPEYYANLAGCYIALNQLSEASYTISEGLEKYPADPELYYYRASLNKKRFLIDKAKEDAKIAIRLGADPRKVDQIFR